MTLEFVYKGNMAHKKSFGLPSALLVLASLGASLAGSAIAHAQALSSTAKGPSSRLAGDWRSSAPVSIPASRPPTFSSDPPLLLARSAALPNAHLDRMLLLLAPSTAQQQALTSQLAALQNPASPHYHQWLTPAAFAQSYSNSAADVSAVAAWLESQGFQLAPLPAGRAWIEFSGTVAQLEQAFHTRVDAVTTPAGSRFVLAEGISVPSALAPVVQGLVSLDGALAASALTQPQPLSVSVADLAAQTSLAHAAALTPQLAAQLLHFDTLNTSGIQGAGQTIAIPARSNVTASDVTAFRAAFGLPASALSILPSGSDPGLTADQPNATLSVSWAGAAAPAAQILLVPAATTPATDGLDLSLAAIVDQALANTVAIGYSTCEAALTPAHQAFYAALYRQAAAEGISILAASGDSGPSACHVAGSITPVSSGYAVNALASTPWNTAVGVAAFGSTGPSTETSSLSAWSPSGAAEPAYAGGGGGSAVYPSPAWQPIPAPSQQAITAGGAHNRLLPDLALPTAIDSGVNPGLAFCLGNSKASSGCTLVRAGGSASATALFAGIAALVNQKNEIQGNLAPHLYTLSRQTGIFSDIAQGTAQLPCVAASSGCVDGEIGFAAASGYDLATGLGVVNAHALVTGWATPQVTGTGLVLVNNTISPGQTINPSGSVVLAASIVSQTGGPAPTGTVSFQDITKGTTVATVALNIGTGETSTATDTVTGVLSQGGHQIEVNYSGDTNYAPANSGPVVIEVQPSSTTTAITTSTATPIGGSTFTVDATVTSLDAGSGALPPSGTVDFRLDGVSQGTEQVVTGSPSTASINMTAPYTAGAHQVVGFYSGDSNYYNSTSQAATITIAQVTPTITLTPATTTPLAGSQLLITASISPPTSGLAPPTGTVTFTLDGASLGSATVNSGTPSTATITITAPGVGGHTLQATYSGDTNYTSVTSSAVTITISKTATTLALVPATTTPLGGSSLQVVATLSITGTSTATPTGTVTFTMDGTTQGTATLAGGTTATTSITVPASGSHTLQASYGGDSNFLASTSPSVNIIVAKTPTTTVVSPATTTPTVGTPLVVNATITPSTAGSTQPTGNVTFTVDGVSAGVESVVAGSPSTASVTISTLTSGTHVLVASYSGDTDYAASVSASVTITVGKSPSTTVVTPATLTPTAGSSLVVAAAVTSASTSSVNPTGTVTFLLDGVIQGTGTVTSGSPSTASFTIPLITAGSHVLTATYSGDTNYAASTSAPVAITASKGATVTTVTATPPVLTIGTAETLAATIAPSAAVIGTVYTITGTVTFYDNGTTLLGTAPVSSNVASLAGVSLANNVSHSITAIYSGDANWLASESTALPLAATTMPDYVVLTSNSATVPPGQALVLTVTVTPTSTPAIGAEQNPTGNVIFYDGTTIIGTVALTPAPIGDSSTATLTTETLPGGQDVLSALYQGDLYYDAEPSNLLTLDVEDFTITPSPSNPPTNLNIVQGASGAASFVITGLGGFNNLIQVVCAVPSQDDMTCTASPQQLTAPGTVGFVIQTFLPGEQAATTTASQRTPPVWPRAAGGAALALLGFFLLPIGRRARIFTRRTSRRVLVLLLLLAGLGGAGIGCTSVAGGVNGTGTPLGVATLKITASAYIDNTVVSHSVYLTVNVIAPGSTQ
jgi:subtilase family serine protease